MKPAYGYVRCSTTKQADEGVSLDAQKAKIADYCRVNEMELREVFVDSGISGKKMTNRAALNEALKVTCADGAALVVYSLSRLARSTRDAIAIAERLEKSGADLVSISERLDTTSAAGKMIFRVMSVMAEFERDLISERTTMALRHIRESGRRISRHTPYGFDLAGDTLTPNASEQATIEEMRRMRGEGYTFSTIGKILTEKAIPTKQGKSWRASSVQRILERRGA